MGLLVERNEPFADLYRRYLDRELPAGMTTPGASEAPEVEVV